MFVVVDGQLYFQGLRISVKKVVTGRWFPQNFLSLAGALARRSGFFLWGIAPLQRALKKKGRNRLREDPAFRPRILAARCEYTPAQLKKGNTCAVVRAPPTIRRPARVEWLGGGHTMKHLSVRERSLWTMSKQYPQ